MKKFEEGSMGMVKHLNRTFVQNGNFPSLGAQPRGESIFPSWFLSLEVENELQEPQGMSPEVLKGRMKAPREGGVPSELPSFSHF
jgi:hypothetical protein